VTFIQNEIAEELSKLKEVPYGMRDAAVLGKAAIYLFMFSMMPFMRENVKILEKIYLNNRTLQDMIDDPSNAEAKKVIINENAQNKRAMSQYIALLFSHGSLNRPCIYQFARWSACLFNRIDSEQPEILYILPEAFVEIPFEVFRALKRGDQPLYESE
jgi:hypothetical protein